MDLQREHWNKIYSSSIIPKYEPWLDKYGYILKKSKDVPVIDLGCGSGHDTFYLKEKGYKVISCDFSDIAIKRIKYIDKNIDTRCFDMKEGLPFKDNSTKVIIADLSLHYFSSRDTQNIVNEIHRVLSDNGCLICRVNSTKDVNHGAGQGTEIEENFYENNGLLKRFFNEESLKNLFYEWDIKVMKEVEALRFDMKKIAWEVVAKR